MKTTQIIESFVTKGQILEQASKNDAILCRAKYQICSIGEKNRNNRVYEKAVWDKVLADPEITAKLENKSLFFHAEHPTSTQSNTEKVAGVVTDMVLNEEENKVYAVMEVLDTPYGRIVDTLLRAGCGIGVSTRADGELEEALDEDGSGYQRVVPESYRFVTIDFTADPSTFGSELPLTVERDVTKVIKNGLEDNKIDRQYATVLLEKLYSPEAVALLETLKNEAIMPPSGEKPLKYSKKSKEGVTQAQAVSKQGAPNEDKVEKETITCPDCGEEIEKEGDIVTKDCACGKDRTVEEGKKKPCKRDGSGPYKGSAQKKARKKGRRKYISTSDLCDQPADAKAAAIVVKKSSKKSAKKNEGKLSDTEMIKITELNELHLKAKTKQFLTDNWDSFTSHEDAVENVVKVFKIEESDAKKYVDVMESSKGIISTITTKSNEKENSSDSKNNLSEMSEKFVIITAERDKLVESYGKDIAASTIKIQELNQQLLETDGVSGERAKLVEMVNAKVAELTKELKETNEVIVRLTEAQEVIKSVQEKKEKETKKLEENHKKEVDTLKESHKKDLISFYVSTKTKGMGLKLPESALTLLETCTTVKEVDALIRRTQNAIRENLVQSADGLSEIVMESQSDPNPVVADIKNKVGMALKHFGV